MYTKFKERKIPKAASGSFTKTCFSVRHMLYRMFILKSVAKILENYLWISLFLEKLKTSPETLLEIDFLKKNLHSHRKIYQTAIFHYSYFVPNFSNRYFSELLLLVAYC